MSDNTEAYHYAGLRVKESSGADLSALEKEFATEPLFTPTATEDVSEGNPAPLENPDPIFAGGNDAEQEKPKNLDDEMARFKLDMFLQARNHVQAHFLALIAKSKDPEQYKLDEDDLEMLAQVYLPYMKQYGGKIPEWLSILMVELLVMGKKIIQAIGDRKTNARNILLAKSPIVGAAIQKVAKDESAAPWVRNNWRIDAKGRYEWGPYGYIKVADRTETASLDDIEQLLRSNGVVKMKKAFSLSQAELHPWIQKVYHGNEPEDAEE